MEPERVKIYPTEFVCGNPIVSWLIFILLMALGIYGSMFGDQMRETPFNTDDYIILWGWGIIYVTAILAYANTRATNDIQLVERNQLFKLYQTMPAEGFLAQFSEVYRLCNQSFNDYMSLSAATKDDSVLTIRTILRGIVSLISAYERSKSGRYGINLMVFYDTTSLTQADITRIEPKVRFLNPDTDMRKLKGVLVLDPILTNSSNVSSTEQDDDFTDVICMPVPQMQKNPAVNKYIALPGAPLAFLSNFTNQYDDVSDIYNWMEEEGDFTESTTQAVKTYFSSTNAENIRSFICQPLCISNTPFAVLNIHKNSQNILSDQDQRNQFMYVISPLLEILTETLQIHSSKFPVTP